jgi:SAM-dependent methyltransferase
MLRRLRAKLRSHLPPQAVDTFKANGSLPWTPGYEEHKAASVAAAINDPDHDAFALKPGYGWRLDERIVEFPWFMSRLPAGESRLLDAGSTLNHAHVLQHPKLKEKKVFISTLAPEHWAAWQWGVSYVFEDMRDACFKDAYFDNIACISTMEHVGLDNTMLYTGEASKNEADGQSYATFLAELRRMLKPGGTLYLSMPFGRHENHGWFQVFDGPMVDEVIRLFRPASHVEIIYQYLPEGWVVSTREAAKDALYFDIHKKKTYDPDHAAASRAVVCLELTR